MHQITQITIEQARETAARWQAEGKSWHFHALAPDCRLNERRGRYALVLENRSDDQTLAVYSDRPFTQASQELVKLLHGDRILDRAQVGSAPEEGKVGTLLRRAEDLHRRNIHWHHHMLFPDCIYNAHPGRWNIVFEDGETEGLVEVLYDEQPVADLRRIEVAYFEQVDPSF